MSVDANDPTLPRVVIVIDPETMQYSTVFEGPIDMEVWIGVLNDLIEKTQTGQLPTD